MKPVFEHENAKIFCVYKHTVPDGRYYIGFTHNTQSRWGRGCNYKQAPLFYPLIKEYGWDAIKHEVLISSLTLKEACAEEKRFIKEAQENGISLNVSRGGLGGGVPGLSHGPRTAEVKRKISEHNSGKKHTQEHIEKFRRSNKWRFRPVRVYKDGNVIGEYENAHQASIALGIEKVYIYTALKRKSHYTSGYIFEELENNTERAQPRQYYRRAPRIDPITNKIRCIKKGSENHLAKPILQYMKDGTFIKEWGSTTEVFNTLNISRSAIANCLAGLSKTAGGYVWKHK